MGILKSLIHSHPNQYEKFDIKILSTNQWSMHAQTAQRFINPLGNILLAGDAAHRFPPAGGFGMNTGLQDVHNLAWKLALVTAGLAKEKLVHKTYEEGMSVCSVRVYVVYECRGVGVYGCMSV